MSFRIGLVGLCTSHPGTWIPIIRKLTEEGLIDAEITAAWDSGETRPAGYTGEFCNKMSIPHPLDNLSDMMDLVDGVIVHTTNWNRHLEQAEAFVKAGKSVYIDKPIVGNMTDANQFLDWLKQGYCVTGGSVLRYCKEVKELLAQPVEERGAIRTAYTCVGKDDLNYGIHGYSLLSGLFGRGIRSVKYLGQSNQKQIMIRWQGDRIALMTLGRTDAWIPFQLTVTTDKRIFQIPVNSGAIYRSMLQEVMPYFTRKTDVIPLPADEILEPELAAIAARQSWLNNGQEVFLDDLGLDSVSYDGHQFAREYARSRMGTEK